MECDIDGQGGDPMEDFGIIPKQVKRRGAANRGRREREDEEYIEGMLEEL